MHRNKVLAPHTLNKLNQNHFKSVCTRILNEANAPKLPWLVMNNNQDCRALQLRAFRLRSATRQCCPIHGAGGKDKTVSFNVDGLLNFPVLTVPKLHRINSFTFQTQLLSSRENNRPVYKHCRQVQSFNLAKVISRKMPISRRECNL